MGIFIDFSKAFDTVNHKILLDKLAHYGIRGIANDWVGSYLKDRQQFCTYMGKESTMKFMKCGVPQGSILGPLLFLLYINDLGDIFQNLFPVLYADDSNLIATGNSLQDLERNINNELPLLSDWLKANRLSLNIKKI
jgi:retron-type reverse transcriptase